MTETWLDIDNAYGKHTLYQVSNLGNVRKVNIDVKTAKPTHYHIMRTHERTKGGSKIVGIVLRYGAIKREHIVARLVAEAFIHNPDGCKFVFHKDGDFRNNRVDNLEWRKCPANWDVNYFSNKKQIK